MIRVADKKKKPVKSIYEQIVAHPLMFSILTIPILVILIWSIYLVSLFSLDTIKSIAGALVVYDGVILGFTSLLLMEEFRYINESLKFVNEYKGKPQYETYKHAMSLAKEYFYFTEAVIIALALSGLFGLMAISGMKLLLDISLVLVYFGTWFILYYTARMVKGRDWLMAEMMKE